jgi:hypothetical protein
MKSRSFRAALFILFFIIITIFFYLIGHQLVIISIFYPVFILLIGFYLGYFLGIFDNIEKNSSLRYWEIKRDHDTDGTIKKIRNFLCSFGSLFSSNLLIAITSIFFLYKLDSLSNNDPTLLIFVSTTVIILIRILVYSNREIAREIGKGFRYAMFPLGFALFFWDFLFPLVKQYGNGFIFYIVNKYDAMLIALLIVVLVITSLEPIFSYFNETMGYNKSTETRFFDWMVGKLIKK